jgi:hypothetical protein
MDYTTCQNIWCNVPKDCRDDDEFLPACGMGYVGLDEMRCDMVQVSLGLERAACERVRELKPFPPLLDETCRARAESAETHIRLLRAHVRSGLPRCR